jgi:outer membrane murein-binding lipoprotein Lpp
MKILKLIALGFSTALLAGCASGPEFRAHDWAYEAQTAESKEAHLRLAKHYEEVARMMDAEAEEERRMLTQYRSRSDVYGNQILDLNTRAEAMVRDFEKTAADSRKMAEYHRQLAAGRPK